MYSPSFFHRKFSAIITLFTVLFFFSFSGWSAENQTEAFLEMSLDELLDTEVSVSTKEKILPEEAPSAITVLTREEIRNMGAYSLSDILKTVPGLDIVNNSALPTKRLIIRGIGGLHNNTLKVMINGHSLNTMTGDGPGYHLDTIPVGIIKRIEIIRGPGGALYGNGAFAGVISIITKDGETRPSIAMEAGYEDTFRVKGEYADNGKNTKTYLYGDCSTTNGFDGTIRSDAATRSSFLASSFPASLTSGKDTATLHTRVDIRDITFTGYIQKVAAENPLGIMYVATDENEVESLYAFGDISLNRKITDKLDIGIRGYLDFCKLDQSFETYPQETADLDIHSGFFPGEGLYSSQSLKFATAGAECTGNYRLFKGLRLFGGMEYACLRQYDLHHQANYNPAGAPISVGNSSYPGFPYVGFPNGITDISDIANFNHKEWRNMFSMYSMLAFDMKKYFQIGKIIDILNFTAGIRMDAYDDVDTEINPRFGFIFAPSEHLYYKVLFGKSFRAPSFHELYSKGCLGMTGNPDLDPENIQVAEGQLGFHLFRRLRSSLTIFNIRGEDMIKHMDGMYQNAEDIRANGVEVELKYGFTPKKYITANMTWQSVKNTNNRTIVSDLGQTYTQKNYDVGNIPSFYCNLGINYDFSDHLLGHLSLRHVGERKRSEEKIFHNEELVPADSRGDLSGYTVVDLTMLVQNIISNLDLSITAFNLFDEEYAHPEEMGFLEFDLPRPGRTLMGRIVWHY